LLKLWGLTDSEKEGVSHRSRAAALAKRVLTHSLQIGLNLGF